MNSHYSLGLTFLLLFNLKFSHIFQIIFHCNIFKYFLVLLPTAFLTIKLTVYFPTLLYLCTGFWSVEMLLLPKFQDQEVDDPVLLSVNFTVSGAFPVVGDAEKFATGSAGFSKTFIVASFESVPFALATVELTAYVPGNAYKYAGF